MSKKPNYEELEQRIKELEKKAGKHKNADKELSKYQFMIESAHDAIFFKDLESRYVIANDKTLETFGLSREDVIGKNDYELMPDHKEAKKNVYDDQIVFKSEKSTEIVKHMTGADGKKYWFQAIKVPQFDNGGKVIGLVGIARDITERKRAEELLRDSEEKCRTILEGNPDPVVVYDMQGKVRYLNPAFTSVFEWTLEELLGKKMDVFVPEEAWPGTKMIIEKVLAGEMFSNIETRRKTKNGKIVPVSISGATYSDQHGNPLGSIINLRDIREQKKLETQLQRAQKMEALGILAGGVAHDLNNVLSGIVTYPELLLMQIPEDSPLRKPIITIMNSGKKAAAIVKDLLTLARREIVTEKVVNLNEIISQHLKSPEHEKLKSFHPRVEVETSLESDLFNISGSPVHLSIVVMNLVSNAAEAMPDGGKIFLSTENRYIDRPINGYDNIEEGDYVVLAVSDTGIGISSEDIKRIFEPFYTKKVMGKGGTGLGMAVVWSRVKDYKGYIDVQSIEGKGTTFTLYFSATRRAITKEKAKLPIENYMGKGESILVVDDVKEQREIVFKLLTILGYVVDTVSSGEEAVEYLKEHSVDLIVLDMIMDPGIDGLDTYKKILEAHPDQKAIIASGFSETDRVREVQRLSAGQYIKKPYTFEKIGIAVRAELDK
jgi:PAS domain S-box-containing protein